VASLKIHKRQQLEDMVSGILAVADIHAVAGVAGVPGVACFSSADDVPAFTGFLFIAYV
jgi:hypothetical protein